jgi:hypothetical protein
VGCIGHKIKKNPEFEMVSLSLETGKWKTLNPKPLNPCAHDVSSIPFGEVRDSAMGFRTGTTAATGLSEG